MHWNFNSSVENETTLRPLCEEVDRHFPLATDRYYRYFALPNRAVDDEYLAGKIGKHFRGVHIPTSGTDDVCRYLKDRCLPLDGSKTYDNLVFIRHSTCRDPTGCVITYAHELQHIVQEGRYPRLAKVNNVLRANLWKFKQIPTEIDLPSEVEANIVSKRVAESVRSVEAVKKFAEEQVSLFKGADATDQVVRWEFFTNTPSSTSYDFVKKTLELVENYKGLLDFGMNVDMPGWWNGPLPTAEARIY